MPIYFRTTPVQEPFMFDSIGCRWEQERTVRSKGYPLYHYLQTEEGIGEITISGKHYLLNKNEGVLIAPFISHSYAGKTGKWLTSFATFTGISESSLPGILGNRQLIFTSEQTGQQIEKQIASVIEKYQRPPVDTRLLSVDCYALLMNFTDGGYTQTFRSDPLYIKYVAPVIRDIETCYNTELTVQDLSRKVFVSPQYLSRLFGRFLGCSVYGYLTNYRIAKAKEYLLTSPWMKIQDVARQVGFLDTSHFITMFKKAAGMTPLEFRRLN